RARDTRPGRRSGRSAAPPPPRSSRDRPLRHDDHATKGLADGELVRSLLSARDCSSGPVVESSQSVVSGVFAQVVCGVGDGETNVPWSGGVDDPVAYEPTAVLACVWGVDTHALGDGAGAGRPVILSHGEKVRAIDVGKGSQGGGVHEATEPATCRGDSGLDG